MILQPGAGPIHGRHYLPADPDAGVVAWGLIPTAASLAAPALRVCPGATVTIDTVSHEGVLDDFGRDPVRWFGAHGVAPGDVLADAVRVAASLARPAGAGPHVLTGPVWVEGAAPGDVLVVDVLALAPRVPYGVVSNRHHKGVLPEMPGSPETVSVFTRVEDDHGVIPFDGGTAAARLPLAPFLGVMGVAVDADAAPSTTPPGAHGGNLDVKWLRCGSRLYLPVQVEGAGFYAGDPHFAQGNGEVCLTALEGSLRADLRLSVLTGSEARALGGLIGSPFAEDDTHWMPVGLGDTLDQALEAAVRRSVAFLGERLGMEPHLAYAYLSAAADFEVTQAVNQVKGVHARIRKSDFAGPLASSSV